MGPQDLHCSLSRYIRLAGFWQTVPLLERGLSFTEAAHAAGFHDLSHYNRVVAEVSGVSPTLTLDDCGHLLMMERPAAVSEWIRDAVRRKSECGNLVPH